MFEAIGNAMKSILYWFINMILELCLPLLESIFDSMPELSMGLTAASEWLSYIEFFFPLKFALTVGIAFLTFELSFALVKLILKLIPTVG